MIFVPKRREDLFSVGKMEPFFGGNCSRFFSIKKLVSLKILPKKRIAKNPVILYELVLSDGKKRIKKLIWGKAVSARQKKLLDSLAKKGFSRHLPKRICYLRNLNFDFSEDIKSKAARELQNNFSFWGKNISEIANVLLLLQKLGISGNLVKNHSLAEEKVFLKNSLRRIKKYSPSVYRKYIQLAEKYQKVLALIPKDRMNSVLCHFDFQPGNIFYNQAGKNFYILDFDLCEKFHPALDLANFLSHFYVMSRYRFGKKMVKKFISDFMESDIMKSISWREDIDVFKLRSIIDIAQITAASFGKPSVDSKKVFEKLDELLKICL
jgi:hypothetical protein